jgi:hypothetical protein
LGIGEVPLCSGFCGAALTLRILGIEQVADALRVNQELAHGVGPVNTAYAGANWLLGLAGKARTAVPH